MRPRDIPCPTCAAAVGAACLATDGIDPGMTHRTRAEEASRLTPRPPAPDRERVEGLYREREQAWAALDAASRGEG